MPSADRRIRDEHLESTSSQAPFPSWWGLCLGASLLCAGLLFSGCGLSKASCPSAQYQSQSQDRAKTAPRTTAHDGSTQPRELETVSRRVLALTNQKRREHGLEPLKAEDTLGELACRHNRDMLSRSFFAHENPDGEAPSDRLAQYHRRLIGQSGENIWSLSAPNLKSSAPAHNYLARSIVNDWMDSPGHRKNILRPEFTHLGVCVVRKGDEIRATQSFADAWAYLDTALPKQLPPSTKQSVSVKSVPGTASPTRYDFVDPSGGERVAGPHPFEGQIQTPKNEGAYRLRFHFPRDGGWVLVTGPEVTVAGETEGDPGTPVIAEENPNGDGDFRADVIEKSHDTPVLVDFWAPWCGPCRELSPVLASLDEAQDGWTLETVNVDERSRIAQQHDVRGVPTVTLFADGKATAEFTGAMSKSAVRAWLDENVPAPTAASNTSLTASSDSTSNGSVGW